MESAPKLNPPEPIKTADAELLSKGAAAYRRGDRELGRKLVAGAIALNPENETAWLFRASMANNAREAKSCLKQLLSLNPEHAKGRELLEKLKAASRRRTDCLDVIPDEPIAAQPSAAEELAPPSPAVSWLCPICEADCLGPRGICANCRSLVDLGRIDEISRHHGADKTLLLSSIEKLSSRDADFEGCIGLALAHLNLKSSQQAVEQLEVAREFRPLDPALSDVISRLKQRPLVMVLDDSKTVRGIVSSTLERRLFRVFAASDGQQALDAAQGESPRAFLVDASLPGMTGYEVCKALKKSDTTKQAPVILMGETYKLGDRIRGKMAGASDYLRKPFTEDGLVDILLAHLK